MFLQQCPHCAHVNPTASRFCNACGGPLDLAPCPQCGAINAAGDASCRECGARLAAPGEREPALRREHEATPQRTTAGLVEHAARRDAPKGERVPISSQPSDAPRSAAGNAYDPRPVSVNPAAGARNASRRAPHAAMTLIAASLIAMALLALGYAFTLRNTLGREGAAPAPTAPVAASPRAAPPPPAEAPAPRAAATATPTAPATPAPPPAASTPASTCPPAVDAMGLCRTYDAAAARN